MGIDIKNIRLGYGKKIIIDDMSVEIPRGGFTVIVGGNGSGKSTLLYGLARLLRPASGEILVEGKDIFKESTKRVAQKLSLLPQSPQAPEGITIFSLVKQGRYPYQSWCRQWSKEDERAVGEALRMTDLWEMRDDPLSELSGGQKQRAWIAMLLAQDTEIMLLDEPTNHLDMHYQLEILDLLARLNREHGRTVALVLHDINLAARYASSLIAMKNGEIFSRGGVEDVLTEENIHKVFNLKCRVITCPVHGTPLCVPYLSNG